MTFTELDRDERSGLALAVDDSTPVRYYLIDRRRRDLLSIRDLALARSRFAARVEMAPETWFPSINLGARH